jgi:hypothetical protein
MTETMTETMTNQATEQAINPAQLVDESNPAGKMRLVTLSSGVRVVVRRMNLTVLQRLNDSYVMPEAPAMEVVRPDGTTQKVANELDPMYQASARRAERGKTMRVLQFAAGLYVKLFNEGHRGLTDAQREELAALEEAIQAETGKGLDGRNDEAKYILNCAIDAADDYGAITSALFAQADNPK